MSKAVYIIRQAIAEKYGYEFLQSAEKADLDYTTKAINAAAAFFDAHESADCLDFFMGEENAQWKGDEEEAVISAEALAPQFAEMIFAHFAAGLTRDEVLTIVNSALRSGVSIMIKIAAGIERDSTHLITVWNGQHPEDAPINFFSNGVFA